MGSTAHSSGGSCVELPPSIERKMEDSDRRLFVPSPSPVEEFEGDADQEWEVAGIVGQSIDVFGEKR